MRGPMVPKMWNPTPAVNGAAQSPWQPYAGVAQGVNTAGLPGWHPWMKDIRRPMNPARGGLGGLLQNWMTPTGNTGIFSGSGSQNMAGMNYGVNYAGPRQEGGLESVLNSYSPKMKTGPY